MTRSNLLNLRSLNSGVSWTMSNILSVDKRDLQNSLLPIAALVLLYFSSLYNYLLFHSLAEIFSICIAITTFSIAWNSREYMNNNYLLFIGISYLFIGVLDLFHTLSYKGMNIFTDYDFYANQLWIAARFMESCSFLIAFFFLFKNRAMNSRYVLIMYVAVTAGILLSIFTWKVFPICFIDGTGLTPFKVYSEYVICVILLIDTLLLVRYRRFFDDAVYKLLIWSLLTTIASELAFTVYISNYGFSNLVGHYFKIISFYFMYKAIIEKGVKTPYALIFRELKLSEAALAEQNRILENLASIDGLTGLFNHGEIYRLINDEIERVKRYDSSFSVIMFDIDHFKLANDTYGHVFGDSVISSVAQIIKGSIRSVDMAGRYGGDEFIVVLPQIDMKGCLSVAERIRMAVEKLVIREGFVITVSAGIAAYFNGLSDDIVNTADERLYRAKQHGRNRIVND